MQQNRGIIVITVVIGVIIVNVRQLRFNGNMQPSSRDHRIRSYERIVTRIRLNVEQSGMCM